MKREREPQIPRCSDKCAMHFRLFENLSEHLETQARGIKKLGLIYCLDIYGHG